MNRIILICIIFCIKANLSFSQAINRPEIDLEAFIRNTTPFQTEELNFEDLYESIYTLYQNPIDVNAGEISDFRALFFMSEAKVNAIINHRARFGPYLSIYELQAVEGISIEDIKLLLPFITLRENYLKSSIKNRITEHYVVVRADQTLQTSKGYREDKYLGSPQRYYTRYRMNHVKDFSLGFVNEKDAGEQNLTDYFNFHIQVQNKGALKNIIVGDYLMQFGQGLIFSAGFAPGKGSEPIYTTRRSNLGIRPYNSVVENASFRGIASTIKVKKLEITTMVANNNRDASGSVTADGEELDSFSSISTSGFHRTNTEILNRKTINEKNFGANILYKINNLQLGFSSLYTQFDKIFQKRTLPYNAMEFSGSKNLVAGPNFSLSWQNFNVFGEAARSTSGGFGYILGTVGTLSAKTEWAINVRNYQPDFHSRYSSGFSEGSRTINEKGFYTGLKYTIKKGLVLSSFYDKFSFPYLRYRVDAPSEGFDYQLRLLIQTSKTFSQYLAYHHEEKQRNATLVGFKTNQLETTKRNNLVYNLDFYVVKTLRLQTKIQYNNFLQKSENDSHGLAIIQDVEAKIRQIQIKTRVAYFNTTDYDSRIYAYENDVLYAVSFPAYYGRGMRYYGIVKLPIGRKIDAWLRVAHTKVNERDFIGSGNDQLPGNAKTDVRLQLKYSFY